MSNEIQYTTGEQAARVGNAVRGCWRIVRGRSTGRIDAADERREARAADRTDRDRRAAVNALDRAKDELAAAKVAERNARGDDRRAARQARVDAQAAARKAEQTANRYR